MKNKDIMRRNALYIIRFAIGTRLLLFIRDMLMASRIGANYKMDAYLLALSTIMLLTKIVGDGLIVAIIPLVQEIQGKHGEERTIEYMNNLINITALVSFVLMIIGYLGAPIIIKIFGPGFKGVELEKTILLFRIGLPIIVLSWIRAIGAGYLQADHAFKAGAKGGIANASVYIIYLLFFSERFGARGLMVAGILGIVSQIYIIVRTMEKKGYRYKWRLNLKDRYLPRVIKFLLPIIIGIGINELNNSIDNGIASTLAVGSIAELNYANEIINFFIGIFVAAIVTVIFPILSESHNKKDIESLKVEINHGIATLVKVSLSVSIILMTMAEPIVKIVFERGAFDAEASFFTAEVLVYYAVGLTAMSLIPLITRVYYSIHDTNKPVIISILGLIVNVILDLALAPIMGARGLALGTSLSVILVAIIGLWDLNVRLQFVERKKIKGKLAKLLLTTAVMTIGVILTYNGMGISVSNMFFQNILSVGISSVVGIGLYLLTWKVL